MPADGPHVGEIEGDVRLGAADDEWVRHFHPVPGGGEAVAEHPGGEDACRGRDESDGIRATRTSTASNATERVSQASERW